jgi:NAD(P)-dependent dehydrogenase (short-subunit alcohol dehydrogenase family)
MTGRASYDFTGETAIVTGSTKGIGKGIAEGLVDAGANVVVTARTASDVERVAEELDAKGAGDVIGVSADMGEAGDVERLVDRAIDRFDVVDLLVNNAAMFPNEDALRTVSMETWDQAFRVNVRAQLYAAQLVAERLIERDEPGSIVNVTSQTADRRAGPRGVYGVTKTAINGLTWKLAHELAGYDIRVNAISTDMTRSAQLRWEAEREAEGREVDADAILEEWGNQRPIGRLGEPSDLADGVMFLASDRAEYVVGDVLRVSGGGNLQGGLSADLE